MTLDIYNKLLVEGHASLAGEIVNIQQQPAPAFTVGHAPFSFLNQKAYQYSRYKNILIVGYGGSNTSFLALYKALYKGSKYNVEIVNTVDPDELYRLKHKYKADNTLIISISKSGHTLGVIETTMFFNGYTTVVIGSNTDNGLKRMGDKLGYDFIEHPDVGGRFSGRTADCYFPAALVGIDIEKVDYGFLNMYKACNETVPFDDNPALQMAVALCTLETEGFTEIYLPYYSPKLKGLSNLIVQLMHESVCKKGKGQTIYTAFAPEAQHHTNQRLFGGRKNVVTLFLRTDNYENPRNILVPPEIYNMPFKDGTFSMFEGLPLSAALGFELQGTYEHAVKEKIPCSLLSVDRIDEINMGELIAFFQYLAVYSAQLRRVNPFDQPEVEFSKSTTYNLVKNFSEEHEKSHNPTVGDDSSDNK